jgi:uncharacterized membrane protein
MTWADRFRRREGIRHSLWLVPLLGALTGMMLAWIVDRAGGRLDMPSELTFTPATASSVLSAILGAMIGLVGFVVTVTVLLVQTSTSQFSARYMRLVYRDRLLKAVLAVLVGTFAYSFVLLRRVGETESPDLGLVVVGALVLLGVLLFLLFFSRLLQRLRPVAVAASVNRLGIDAFLDLAQPTATPATARELPVADVHPVLGTRTGTIQAASLDGLVRWAHDHSCTLVFRHGVGDFVHPGAPLLDVHGAPPPPDAARSIEGMVALGQERTIAQDPAFAVRVMVDVANRALSAAINDPTTAVQVLDYLEDMLLVIGRTDFSGNGVFCDSDGAPRVVLPSRTWEDYLALGVTEIRQYGGSSVQVVRRLRALLLHLREHVRPENRAAVDEELARLEATVAERFGDGVDLDRALVPDRQGLGGPGRAGAQAAIGITTERRDDMALSGRTSFTDDEARQAGSDIGIDWSTVPFDLEQFRMGMDVELEHGLHDPATDVTGSDPVLTAKIALAHLKEFPDYYTRLERMEKEATEATPTG